MTLALFDFDGTLTTRDTLWEFVAFCHPRPKFWLGCIAVSPWLVLLGLKLISPERAKKKVLAHFFKGDRKEQLEKAGEKFCSERLPQIMNNAVFAEFNSLREQNHTVCVVTASCEPWVAPFCRTQRCELICTELLYTDGSYSGEFSTPNCNREEKAVRIRAKYDLAAYTNIIAFGNRGGDDAMLNLAHERRTI